eukprot:79998_1
MPLRSIILFLWCVSPSFGKEKKLLDVNDLAPSCFEPDPYNVDECFESCDTAIKGWDVSLEEVDFDPDLEATVFTYTVNVWDSGVCRDGMRSPSFGMIGGDEGNTKGDKTEDNTNGMDSEMEYDPSGIEALYIMFSGCCNDSSPIYYTKAITPQLHFDFLKAGWYWKTMVSPGYQNLFGFMIYGDAELTTGTFCVRTGYHCICQPIAVPDLCGNGWKRRKDDEWVRVDSRDEDKSIDKKPIWAKH